MNKIKSEQKDINKQIEFLVEKIFINIPIDIEITINMIYQGQQEILLELIIKRLLKNKKSADTLDGFIFQKLLNSNIIATKNKLNKYFPDGVARLKKSLHINYQPLQKLLMNQNFQEADRLTNKYLCQLVEIKTKNSKKWLYFTDIQFLPLEDLFTLDLLWKIYSRGKFGFSIQKQIWTKNNKNWDKLWEKIGWTYNGTMKRYPKEFEWTLNAPEGHLPLSNQLRGTKTLLYLFNYIK
uniref:GUN4-like domain-containing protein n=1 Tax=Chondria tumulosa TaxID=2740715 RepID=A0A896SU68_9FLOR|nr:hypothetical protein K8K75_pgp183 [Chondria tumulosa]QSD57024.1 hypothetical protein [Chondria tumulosa]